MKDKDISNKEIGRRLFHVHREKRVELAINKMKSGIGPDWKTLTPDKVRILGHLLQCTWNVIDQKVWEAIPFGKLTMNDINKILCYGEGICPGERPKQEAVEEIKGILLAVS